jgi:hypothetical protein
MTTHNRWRDRPAPNNLDEIVGARSGGHENKRPAVGIGRNQSIRSSVGSDPQAKSWGPKGSLIDHGGFGEHGVGRMVGPTNTDRAPADQGTDVEGPDSVPPLSGGRR